MSYASDALIDALTHENEQIKSENTKLRNELEDQEGYDQMLRDRLRQQTELCVKAEDENKRLCNERERLFQANVEKNGEILRLLEDNAKLRELCANMLHDAMENVCSKSYWCDEKNWQTCNDKSCGSYLYVEMARELGVEVDA